MSLISSAASAVSASDSKEPGCELLPSARSSHTPAPSCESTGPASPAMMTCEILPLPACWRTALRLTRSVAASLAKISVRREAVRASRASAAAYGENTPALLASFDPDTSSWKTSQGSLLKEWGQFSGIWPRSGTMQNGTAYLLPPLARHTYGTGFGSSPTHSIPTPTASDHIERRCTSIEALNFETNKSVSLDRFARMWPTVTVHGNYNRKGASKDSGDGLATAVGGCLNPTWVEWLMGFPMQWTELKDWVTPLCRPSRKSSVKP